jgi:glycerate kinase
MSKKRIVVAPGSFKGSIRCDAVAQTICERLRALNSELDVVSLPLADGGEGTVEMFEAYFGATTTEHIVDGPYGDHVQARVCTMADGTAVIETSEIIGLSLAKGRNLNPLVATSRGVGQAIRVAAAENPKRIFVTMGDSATMDMGLGMLHELGARFLREDGREIFPEVGSILSIASVDFSPLSRFSEVCEFVGLVDTDDFLIGNEGQVQLYGAQKGLRKEDIPHLEDCYAWMAKLIDNAYGTNLLTKIRATGSGGLGAGLFAGLQAELFNTLEYLADLKDWRSVLRSADLIITGEGCLDNQTRYGKVPFFVTKTSGVKCIAVVGSYTPEGKQDFLHINTANEIVVLDPACALNDPTAAIARACQELVLRMG